MINSIIKMIRPYMKENGFSAYKRCFYYINNDLAYCVELETPSCLIYINYYIIPLYVPSDYRYYTYGVRLGKSLPSTSVSTAIFEEWTNEFKKLMNKVILPTFRKVQSPDSFTEMIIGGLFDSACHISELDIYRLRLFTTFYKKETANIPTLCDKYVGMLRKTTYLTDETKKQRLDECEKIKASIYLSVEEIEELITAIIKNTKQGCFGIKTGDNSV